MSYHINLGVPYWQFDHEQVKRIEPKAIYVADLAVRMGERKNWSTTPAAIFYTPSPREGFTNHYFGVFQRSKYIDDKNPRLDFSRDPKWFICNADSVAEHAWRGLERNGEVVFSRWGHDFRTFHGGGPLVDGGPEYTRVVFEYEELQKCNDVLLHLVDGKFEVEVTKRRCAT